MAAEIKKEIELEIAHVLFVDIVGYSKLLINDQRRLLEVLNRMVRETEQFRAAEEKRRLIAIPAGDGMALVFYSSPEAPVECALELSRADKAHPELRLRMGVHSGAVSGVIDVSGRANIAGPGINMAQRVMDCGDAGHILLSKRVAEDIEHYAHWQPLLHELGECEVKHGVTLSLVNLYTDELGNPEAPEKFKKLAEQKQPASEPGTATVAVGRRNRWTVLATVFLVSALLLAGVLFLSQRSVRSTSVPAKPVPSAPAIPAIPKKSIAVLPFENLSAEKENAFFADGMQDDILTSLTRIAELKVISRTSVMQYRGAAGARNLRDIAKALGVANILEGSVRRAGNRVLVAVQLIDASSDQHIWAERYDRTIVDSIGLQGELATEIAGVLKAKLSPEETTSLGTKPTSNSEAYVAYLRALDFEENAEVPPSEYYSTLDGLYAKAIALDPAFALAQARASISFSNQFHETHELALKAKARALADEALRLSPALGEAHLALGIFFYLTEEDYRTALDQFTIALTALPNSVEVLQYTARIYRRQGRWREAIAGFEHARSLNPNAEPMELVRTLWAVRDWPATAAAIKRNLQRQPPGVPFARMGLSQLEVVANCELPAARAWLRKIPPGVDPDGEVTLANWNLSMLERDWDGAAKWLAKFPADEFSDAGPKSFYQAQIALARGEVELADKLFEDRRPALESHVRDHPEDPGAHAALGILYGYMGRKEDALRESRRAVELCPESTDALNGVQNACDLALVYALTGEVNQAVTLLERLLHTPGATLRAEFYRGGITQAELRLRWQWDKLRGDPRFRKMLDGPEPKTIY
jgi:TolB-like protein/tetratricopeptide (TPR) repeat protein